MSSALGLAATAAVLQQMLQNGLSSLKIGDVLGITTPHVSCMPADRIDLEGAASQLNLFLYQQTRNPGWANMDLPSRDSRGERRTNPALALDLHFLVTAYGVSDFHAEVLLGAAMQILHESAVFGRAAIRAALKSGPAKPNLPVQLELAGLADQLEQLRITPLNFGLDDLARIWSAIQLPLRPSAAYQVSVVLIDSARSASTALPVRSANIYVAPFNEPRIDRVEAAGQPNGAILPDTVLRVSGARFKGPAMRVSASGLDVTGALSRREDAVLELTLLPAMASGLRSGVNTMQVQQMQLMGQPPVEHMGVESNLASFVLNPAASFSVEPGAVASVVGAVTYKSGKIKVTLTPRVGARQRVRLLLNALDPAAAALAYTFQAPDGNGITAPATDTDVILIAYQHVVQGNYLARVQVDAGVSALQANADGRFFTPMVAP
ncbi:DUF4255 domain-containing protein [Massilia sp. TSP1-1-2]|uniref:DUF4255 domain-containing protein n=1 Tax=Massilia sp. TSP1-1-2 TaxID=2804649 RepID=UPI003CF71E16